MSRGHGICQQRVVDALAADEETLKRGLPLDTLRPVLPSNRSNARRVIATLEERGDLERVTDPETGECRLRLAWPSSLWAWARRWDAEERLHA